MNRFKQALYFSLATLFWVVMSEQTLMGLMLVIAYVVGVKFEPTFKVDQKKLGSIMDGCLMLLVMAIVLWWNQTEKRSDVFILTMTWLPLIFSPFFLLTYYTKTLVFDQRCLWFFFRFQIKRSVTKHPVSTSHVVWAYMALCFLSGSVGERAELFYPLIAILVFLILLIEDQRTHSKFKRAGTVLLVIGLGYLMHTLIFNAEKYIKKKSVEWMLQMTNSSPHLRKQWMAIGDHGKIQMSDEVVMRVKKDTEGLTYFKGAHYDDLLGESHWFNTQQYKEIDLREHKTVVLNDSEKINQNGETWFRGGGDSWIPLPETVSQVKVDDIPKIEIWDGNMLRIPPPFGWAKVNWKGEHSIRRKDMSKRDSDGYLNLPEDYRERWKDFARLQGWSKERKLKDLLDEIRSYFKQHYQYSLDAIDIPDGVSPIFYFLESSKRGHCEHFATASTLILRACEFPTRYVTGYVVREYSEFQDTWLVRGRDAHAWVEVWNGDHWQRFEPTPPAAMRSSPLVKVKDFWDWLMFQIDKFRFEGHEDKLKDWAPWGIGLVMVYLLIRMLRIVGYKKTNKKVLMPSDVNFSVLTGSEDFEKKMKKKGLGRRKGETWNQWLDRLHLENGLSLEAFDVIKRKHLELVYAKDEVQDSEREDLKGLCKEVLKTQKL